MSRRIPVILLFGVLAFIWPGLTLLSKRRIETWFHTAKRLRRRSRRRPAKIKDCQKSGFFAVGTE